ncbi:MAG: hypothetical protein B7Y80_04195 [Hyphomicrobium sp. 32-62-53]|jgi:hypothetical protein|nr:MAG: hypothetical protein B7Z29_06075 [Hyphomicrobium sp. 12-62-95]OYY01109.1 MAG: hypothetical protein B7Y80_04195 [Hyphomicrobium sp. 32-62-53]
MALAIPLIIMTVALLVAFGLGSAMGARPLKQQQIVGALGVAALMLLPLAYDAAIYDGNCYALDGSVSPCSLGERLGQSFVSGFAFTLAPALLWVLVYVMAINANKSR